MLQWQSHCNVNVSDQDVVHFQHTQCCMSDRAQQKTTKQNKTKKLIKTHLKHFQFPLQHAKSL